MKVDFGLALEQPIQQTILPVVITRYGTAQVVGFVPIASTEFNDGQIGQINIAGTNYRAGSVTMPSRSANEHSHLSPPNQFYALLFNMEEAAQEPWYGIMGFRDLRQAGFSSYWNAPRGGGQNHWTFGPLVGSLTVGMDRYTTTTDSPVPPGVEATASLQWTAYADVGSNAASSALEFNWVELFEAEATAGRLPREAVPLAITVVSTPPEFTAALTPYPVIDPRFGKIYNTIRLTREQPTIAAGDYTFEFRIHHIVNNVNYSKDVELTLTIN